MIDENQSDGDLKITTNNKNKSKDNYPPLDNPTTMSSPFVNPYSWMKTLTISPDAAYLIVLLSLTWYVANVMHETQLSCNMQPRVMHS